MDISMHGAGLLIVRAAMKYMTVDTFNLTGLKRLDDVSEYEKYIWILSYCHLEALLWISFEIILWDV